MQITTCYSLRPEGHLCSQPHLNGAEPFDTDVKHFANGILSCKHEWFSNNGSSTAGGTWDPSSVAVAKLFFWLHGGAGTTLCE